MTDEDIKVEMGIDTNIITQCIKDYESMMDDDGKTAYGLHAKLLHDEFGVDMSKLALILLAHPQVTEKLIKRVQ